MSLEITQKTLSSFKVAKKFQLGDQPITNLDYDDSGQFLLSTTIHHSIQLFDSLKGKHLKTIQSQKYGCHLAKFTHNSSNCVYSTTKPTGDDHTIRYLSLVDNSFIRYFKGHTQLVNSIEISPTNDIFLSAAMDNSVRLWDLRASNSQGYFNIHNPLSVAFDPTGLCCGIVDESNRVQLKDVRMIDAKPFLTFDLPRGFKFNKVEFSNDTKHILFSNGINGNHLILDAYSGNIIMELGGIQPIPPSSFPSSGTACFTPDGKFVLSGNAEENIALYKLDMINSQQHQLQKQQPGTYPVLLPFTYLQSNVDRRPRMINFNPKFQQFTSADIEVNMWIPEI